MTNGDIICFWLERNLGTLRMEFITKPYYISLEINPDDYKTIRIDSLDSSKRVASRLENLHLLTVADLLKKETDLKDVS